MSAVGSVAVRRCVFFPSRVVIYVHLLLLHRLDRQEPWQSFGFSNANGELSLGIISFNRYMLSVQTATLLGEVKRIPTIKAVPVSRKLQDDMNVRRFAKSEFTVRVDTCRASSIRTSSSLWSSIAT